jgi:hypothetical protein
LLIGGWIYLHPIKKTEPSEFGGIVTGVVRAKREGVAIEEGYAFLFKAKKCARSRKWPPFS